MSAQPCIACGGESSLLCDFPLGGVIGGVETGGMKAYICIDINQMPYTCDAPLCRGCATSAGNVFFCGKGGGHETVDHCPVHAGMAEPGLEPITQKQAEAMRRQIHAGMRRGRFAIV